MKCPIDDTTLLMTNRLGVEIDYCPTCRGIWLDRGELDKIIERDNAINNVGTPAEADGTASEPDPDFPVVEETTTVRRTSLLGELLRLD